MSKRIEPTETPKDSYLISFGDTMTALLAFFIVLNALAQDQTGADLHAGTGSFRNLSGIDGTPGLFDDRTSSWPVQREVPGPMYIVADDSDEWDHAATGPDEEGDTLNVQNRDDDNFQRFLVEMERLTEAGAEQRISGEVAFDQITPLRDNEQVLNESMREQLVKFLPNLRRKNYELEIRIWATSPGLSAWSRAARQAGQARAEVQDLLKLDESMMDRVITSASPWHSSTVRRPAASFIIRRLGK